MLTFRAMFILMVSVQSIAFGQTQQSCSAKSPQTMNAPAQDSVFVVSRALASRKLPPIHQCYSKLKASPTSSLTDWKKCRSNVMDHYSKCMENQQYEFIKSITQVRVGGSL